jgi:hypothetical protein
VVVLIDEKVVSHNLVMKSPGQKKTFEKKKKEIPIPRSIWSVLGIQSPKSQVKDGYDAIQS